MADGCKKYTGYINTVSGENAEFVVLRPVVRIITTWYKRETRGYRGVQPAPKFPLCYGRQMAFFSANKYTCKQFRKAEIPRSSDDSALQPLPILLHVLDINVSILVREPTLHFLLTSYLHYTGSLTLSDKHRLSLPAATPPRVRAVSTHQLTRSGKRQLPDKKRPRYFTTRHKAILECPFWFTSHKEAVLLHKLAVLWNTHGYIKMKPMSWGSLDGDLMFCLHSIGGLLFGDSDRYKRMNKTTGSGDGASPLRTCWGKMEGWPPLPGKLRVFLFWHTYLGSFFGPWGCYEFKLCCWGRNLSPHFVWVWGLGLTETCISGFLLFGPRGCYESKYGGHLELW
jgi:hypothetical protein